MNSPVDSKNDPPAGQSVEQEFKDFVYIVSHDFNAPLRHIKQATVILLRNLEGKMTDDERRFAGIIEKSVNKCQTMMPALTQYSRLNTQAWDFSEVDCNDVLAQVVERLQALIQERQAVVKVEPLPGVVGDRVQLNMLFHHLIENALKLCPDDVKPIIKVKSVANGALSTFTVEDNGAGIGEKFRERVFEMFYRTDPSSPHCGVGAGLTICRKIVSRHGGKIWVEASESDGTAVIFQIA